MKTGLEQIFEPQTYQIDVICITIFLILFAENYPTQNHPKTF